MVIPCTFSLPVSAKWAMYIKELRIGFWREILIIFGNLTKINILVLIVTLSISIRYRVGIAFYLGYAVPRFNF